MGVALSGRLVENNPAHGMRLKPQKSRDRFLQSDKLPRFFATLAEEPNPTIHNCFLMSLWTGASMAIIGKSLNHKNPATTAIYARLDLDPVRASMERATAAMLTAAGLKKPAEVVKLKQVR